jgi:dTDP-4-amino-4,6-dideoxygalactose transaminase
MAGTFGLAGIYSFSVPKIISGGQGGAIVTNSEELFNKARAFRTHGLESLIDISSWSWPGFNFRYNDVQASIVLEQLTSIEARIAHLREVQHLYRSNLASYPLTFMPYSADQVGPYVEALVGEGRDAFTEFLLKSGVSTRNFYPSLSCAEFFESSGTPNAERISQQGVYLPSGPTISLKVVQQVIREIKAYYDR